jgi:hypothetical protein
LILIVAYLFLWSGVNKNEDAIRYSTDLADDALGTAEDAYFMAEEATSLADEAMSAAEDAMYYRY